MKQRDIAMIESTGREALIRAAHHEKGHDPRGEDAEYCYRSPCDLLWKLHDRLATTIHSTAFLTK